MTTCNHGVYDLAGKRIFVAGHNGMVGSAVARRLALEKNCELLTVSRTDLDLIDPNAVGSWMEKTKPDAVVIAAAKVGGILANSTLPADFLFQNLMISANLIHASHIHGVEKLVYLGSSCIYPKDAPQPISEKMLLTAPLEPTNEPYAIAKIAGVKMCDAYRRQYGCDFVSAMPANLYGPGDNFDLETAHVLPALIRKFHHAKTQRQHAAVVWGSGKPRREFLYVDDCAGAIVQVLKHYSSEGPINIGSGVDLTIRELAELVAEVVGFHGEIVNDTSKPDGTARKLLDVERILALGWKAETDLRSGISRTYRWCIDSRMF